MQELLSNDDIEVLVVDRDTENLDEQETTIIADDEVVYSQIRGDFMGWNQGYTIMEQQVIELYNLGDLNKKSLNALMQPFCNTDIDSGGSNNLKSKDGKSANDIICLIMEPEKYKEAIDTFIPDPDEPDYNEKLTDLWYEITEREWGFW